MGSRVRSPCAVDFAVDESCCRPAVDRTTAPTLCDAPTVGTYSTYSTYSTLQHLQVYSAYSLQQTYTSPQTLKGRGPTLSDADYRTRSWLRLGAGHRVGIQNLPAGRPPTADRRHDPRAGGDARQRGGVASLVFAHYVYPSTPDTTCSDHG